MTQIFKPACMIILPSPPRTGKGDHLQDYDTGIRCVNKIIVLESFASDIKMMTHEGESVSDH